MSTFLSPWQRPFQGFFANWRKNTCLCMQTSLEILCFLHLFSFWPLVLYSAVVFDVFWTAQPKATRTSKIPVEVFFQIGMCFHDSPSSTLERQLMEQRKKNFGFKKNGTEDNENILCAMHSWYFLAKNHRNFYWSFFDLMKIWSCMNDHILS